jgi:hypothetical protein
VQSSGKGHGSEAAVTEAVAPILSMCVCLQGAFYMTRNGKGTACDLVCCFSRMKKVYMLVIAKWMRRTREWQSDRESTGGSQEYAVLNRGN